MAFLLAGEPRVHASTITRTVLTMAPSPASINLFDGLDQSRTIHYKSLQAFNAAIQLLKTNINNGRARNQYLIVRDINKETMKHIDDRGYKGVRYEWHGDLETLIVKVPTKAHETAAGEFGSEIITAASAMGLPRIQRRIVGAATFQAAAGTPRKEGDWSMMPRNLRTKPGDFPTIVVEVGFSETLRKLRSDARLWFSMSNNDVQIVILISVARNEIIFEKWTVEPIPVGQLPCATQSITVTRTQPNNTLAITDGTAPLLEFNKLFLR